MTEQVSTLSTGKEIMYNNKLLQVVNSTEENLIIFDIEAWNLTDE